MKYTITYKNAFLSHKTKTLCYTVGLKNEQGANYKLYLDPKNRNYKRWADITDKGYILTNLTPLKKDLINADSFPTLLMKPEPQEKISFRVCDLQTSLFK